MIPPRAELEISLRAVNTFHMDVPDAFVAAAAALFRAWGPDHPRITEVWATTAGTPAVDATPGAGTVEAHASEPTMSVTVELPALVLQLVTDVSLARRPIATVRAVLVCGLATQWLTASAHDEPYARRPWLKVFTSFGVQQATLPARVLWCMPSQCRTGHNATTRR